MNSKHWVMCNGTPTSILSPLTFDQMADTYGKDYLGEECNVSGLLTAHLASFTMLEQPSNLTTGATMYDPIHEEVFGESNLADSHVPSTVSGKPSIWTDLLGAIEILTDHFQSELNPTFPAHLKSTAARAEDLTLTPRQISDLESLLHSIEPVTPEQVGVIKANPCTQENCPFCPPTEGATVEQFLHLRATQRRVMPDLYNRDGTLNRGVLNDQLKFRKSVRVPTVEDYREAAAGNRPFPVNAIGLDFLADALATLPEIKGVNLKDSTTYRGVMNEAKDLLNDPTAHGAEIVDKILALLGIEDTGRNLLDYVNLPEPKANRFVITRDPVDVFSVFKLFMASTEAQASREASVSRSPDVNLAIYEESVESLKRRTYIAFGDLMNLPRLPLDYIADNAEENVFNLSAKGADFTQHICTVRYNKFEYTIEVFR